MDEKWAMHDDEKFDNVPEISGFQLAGLTDGLRYEEGTNCRRCDRENLMAERLIIDLCFGISVGMVRWSCSLTIRVGLVKRSYIHGKEVALVSMLLL